VKIKSHPAKLTVCGIFLAALTMGASADFGGRWKASFTSRLHPKMFNDILFDFHVERGTLTGTAHIERWPGDAPITDGKIDATTFRSPRLAGFRRRAVPLDFGMTARSTETR
jgi:hypothetical protein